jgi:hypothetical protein
MKFDSKPDIAYLRRLFRDLYTQQRFSISDRRWDWDLLDQASAVTDTSRFSSSSNKEVIDLVDSPIAPRRSTGGGGPREVIDLVDSESVQVVVKEDEAEGEGADDDDDMVLPVEPPSSSALKRRQTSQTSMSVEEEPTPFPIPAYEAAAISAIVSSTPQRMDVVEENVNASSSPTRYTSAVMRHRNQLSASSSGARVTQIHSTQRQVASATRSSSSSAKPITSAPPVPAAVRASHFSPPSSHALTRSRSGAAANSNNNNNNNNLGATPSGEAPLAAGVTAAPNATAASNKLRTSILTRSSTTNFHR